ncbi:unnamed protein product, partial [Allacma fusca]
MDFFRKRSSNCKVSLVICLVLQAVGKIMSFVQILNRKKSSLLSNSENGNSKHDIEKAGDAVTIISIADLFKPVVTSLRIVGTCPLIIKKSKIKTNEKDVTFLLKRHWKTALCVLTGSFWIFCWFAIIWVVALRGSFMGFELSKNSTCYLRLEAHLKKYRE